MTLFIFSILFLFLALLLTLRSYFSVKKIMTSLNTMLDDAINGSFTEKTIDESLFSSIESKLSRYLSASAISAQNVEAEKDTIKELISDISHQTKTPISNIMLYTELLSEQEMKEESRQYLDSLMEQTKKLHFLIASLVKMSRLETGILTLHPQMTPLMPMLTNLHSHFAKSAAKKGLEFTLASTDSSACFDEKWTLEALSNLVDNAIKYTATGGISIQVIPYELFICVKITDTGIGIAEEEQARIFSRFYRSANVSKEEGVGIGLYLARKIIMQEGGYLKLTSIPGKGSAFHIYLPVTVTSNLSKL